MSTSPIRLDAASLRTATRRNANRLLGIAGVAAYLTLSMAGSPTLGPADPAGASSEIRLVRAGDSIQAALDGAVPGDRVIVEAGTYAEQLTLSHSGVSSSASARGSCRPRRR